MKIAIVHDDLIQWGGAERLVLALFELWPEATLFTSYMTKDWEIMLKQKNIKHKVSFMQKLPYKKKLNKYYAGIFLYPLAFESFDFSGYDVVFSVSSRFAHGVITKPSTLHISYINSPGRMFWEFWDYFDNFTFSKKNIVKHAYLLFLKIATCYYRVWDYYAANRADHIIANSAIPKARIQKYYKKDSSVIYPFVETSTFEKLKVSKQDFYLIISRLVAWKKVDIAIEAFKKNGKNLRIIGEGPELANLKALAAGHKNIDLLGHVSEEEKISLLATCCSVIVTQLEDFGMVPLEAMSAGKPVLAFGKGGVLETVVDGKTGKFFMEQTAESLGSALETFNPHEFLVTDCVYQARKFDKQIFLQKISNFVDSVYLES